jgi:hypothetical protein
LYQGTTLRLRKNPCFVSGHDFKAAEEPMFCIKARL